MAHMGPQLLPDHSRHFAVTHSNFLCSSVFLAVDFLVIKRRCLKQLDDHVFYNVANSSLNQDDIFAAT
jgi:hypothetical protein